MSVLYDLYGVKPSKDSPLFYDFCPVEGGGDEGISSSVDRLVYFESKGVAQSIAARVKGVVIVLDRIQREKAVPSVWDKLRHG